MTQGTPEGARRDSRGGPRAASFFVADAASRRRSIIRARSKHRPRAGRASPRSAARPPDRRRTGLRLGVERRPPAQPPAAPAAVRLRSATPRRRQDAAAAAAAPVAATAFSSVSSCGPAARCSPLARARCSGRIPPVADAHRGREGRARLLRLYGGDGDRRLPDPLGLNPNGHKQREGDFRTPEGSYRLARRNPRSDYFLSIQVSYPNDDDRARARQNGVRPGGLDHDPRPAERPAQVAASTTPARTGPTAASRSQRRHGGDLAADRGQHPDRDPRRDAQQVEVSVAAADEHDSVDARVDAERQPREPVAAGDRDGCSTPARGGLYPLFRHCALAVLNAGSESDNAKEIFERYRDFDIRIVRQAWGMKLEIRNAPAAAFVDGEMIRGIKEHLFAVLRDVVYIADEIVEHGRLDLSEPAASPTRCSTSCATPACCAPARPNLVVCWGGHSISREEYEYTKKVGYELGLRGLDVCTGCGPGAMKGPMKGATIGHAKQRIRDGRYIGITEPGIIAAEPPNPIVNQLVIMPDIEKRLEAFVRIGHGIVVFPGGVGTAEEILYLLGILLDPANAEQPLPVVLTGPARQRRVLRADRRVHRRRRSGRSARAVLPHHHRRPAGGGARHGARPGRGARVPPRTQRLLQLQLAAARRRTSSSSRSRRRTRRCARCGCIATSRRTARGGPAPRVLRHRRRQRQGARASARSSSTARSSSAATPR